MKNSKINFQEIQNRRASFNYTLLQKFPAGIMLTGTEVKSVREGRVNLNDAYCYIVKGEIYIKNMFISEYKLGTHYNHEPRRIRKLLLNRQELNKLESKVKERGFSIVPIRLFISERGFVKIEIALATGKQGRDKRNSIKDKDLKRESDRMVKF
jgi:SsrA-binding protein